MKDNLRRVIEGAAQAEGCSLDDLTVLSREDDPYRLDSPSGHRDGAWVTEQLDRLAPSRHIQPLGLHYRIVAHGKIRKPNGALYVNSDWEWLQTAAKQALWLGYVPFSLTTADRDDRVYGFRSNELRFPTQPPTASLNERSIAEPHYALAIFSEKWWPKHILLPIAQSYRAELYLSSGEPNDTFLFLMVASAFTCGQPLVVFICADFDPHGVQVIVLIARKLQALRDLQFPDFQFAIHEVAVTPEQVKTLGLPSTPPKASERPYDKWKAAYGVEPTELDALAALYPEALEEILVEAINPYSDASLDRCVRIARHHSNPAKPLFSDGALISTDMSWVEATRALRRRLGEEP